MKYLEDYNFELLYHPGKANVVADALSRKRVHMSSMMMKELELIEKLRDMNLELHIGSIHIRCGSLMILKWNKGRIKNYNRLWDGWA